MHHEAGVQTVVAGGLPQVLGPMQTVAGSRGARDYEADLIDLDIFGAGTLNPSLASQLPDRIIDFNLDTANFNLQDQVRRGENFPLQFAYEAADCRIYYTKETAFNMSALWHRAAQATWTDRSLCVKYSTNHPSSTSKVTDTVGPSQAERDAWAYPPTPPSASASTNDNPSYTLADLEDYQVFDNDIAGQEGAQCRPKDGNYCKQLACVQAPWCAPNGRFIPLQYQCLRLAEQGCAPGQAVDTGMCLRGECQYCKPKKPVTSQTCGSSTVHNDLFDRKSNPRKRRGRF